MLKVIDLKEHKRKHDYPGYRTAGFRDSTGQYWPSRWEPLRRGSRDARSGKSVIYVEIADEAWWENFAERTSRPYREWMQPIRDEFKRRYFGANAVDLTGMHWYAKAGCSMCPCSPGFILPNHRGSNFWVTLDTDRTSDNPDEAARRLGALLADPTIPLTVSK